MKTALKQDVVLVKRESLNTICFFLSEILISPGSGFGCCIRRVIRFCPWFFWLLSSMPRYTLVWTCSSTWLTWVVPLTSMGVSGRIGLSRLRNILVYFTFEYSHMSLTWLFSGSLLSPKAFPLQALGLLAQSLVPLYRGGRKLHKWLMQCIEMREKQMAALLMGLLHLISQRNRSLSELLQAHWFFFVAGFICFWITAVLCMPYLSLGCVFHWFLKSCSCQVARENLSSVMFLHLPNY